MLLDTKDYLTIENGEKLTQFDKNIHLKIIAYGEYIFRMHHRGEEWDLKLIRHGKDGIWLLSMGKFRSDETYLEKELSKKDIEFASIFSKHLNTMVMEWIVEDKKAELNRLINKMNNQPPF